MISTGPASPIAWWVCVRADGSMTAHVIPRRGPASRAACGRLTEPVRARVDGEQVAACAMCVSAANRVYAVTGGAR